MRAPSATMIDPLLMAGQRPSAEGFKSKELADAAKKLRELAAQVERLKA
jgi:hypothetical protein